MKNSKFTQLQLFHLILMVLVIIFSLVNIFLVMRNVTFDATPYPIETFEYEGINALLTIALICGIIYLCSDYSKKAAIFYKALLFIQAFVYILGLILTTFHDGFGLFSILSIIKIAILFILAFFPDLGKRSTWLVFYIMFSVDFILAMTIITPTSITLSRIITSLSRLVLDGTVGLTIKGKYDDKDARGTE